MFEALWHSIRGPISAFINLFIPVERASLPQFSTPEQVGTYLVEKCSYTGDPLGGLIDFSYHPEKLQYFISKGITHYYPIDCDDFACYAYLALSRIPNVHAELAILAGDNGAYHMICCYVMPSGSYGAAKCGAIDVNGHHHLGSINAPDLCRHFSAIYNPIGIKFTSAKYSSYPFQTR